MLRLVSQTPARAPTPGDSAPPSAGRPGDPLFALASAARTGDGHAARTLLVTVGPPMLRVVRGVLGAAHPDVEDTLQDAMVAVHLALPGFRGECTTLHFACRIAVQTAMNARRRSGTRSRFTRPTAPEEIQDFADEERSPAELLVAGRRREGLRRLLVDLPEPQAEVLTLHSVLGYTVEETALATATPVNTVRSRLRNALSKLRDRLGADSKLRDLVRGDG